jgi:hypothetical protein
VNKWMRRGGGRAERGDEEKVPLNDEVGTLVW